MIKKTKKRITNTPRTDALLEELKQGMRSEHSDKRDFSAVVDLCKELEHYNSSLQDILAEYRQMARYRQNK